jgi:hypothetical protein
MMRGVRHHHPDAVAPVFEAADQLEAFICRDAATDDQKYALA